MKKIKIGRYSFVNITKNGDIDYKKWIDFIESHKDYFIWYEDTEDGIYRKNNMDKVPNDFKEGILYKLNKTNVYCTKKITKPIAEILLEMANYLEAKIIIDDKKEFISLEQ